MPTCFGPIARAPMLGPPVRVTRKATSAIRIAARMTGPTHMLGLSQELSIRIARCPRFNIITTKMNNTIIAPA
jgi:hypothetical protein